MRKRLFLLPSLLLLAASFSAAAPADTRAAFLKLLDRPRVPLAPAFEPPVEQDGLLQLAFSYASDADNRVPGLLVKVANSSAPARHPAVIVLHGTGGKKIGRAHV